MPISVATIARIMWLRFFGCEVLDAPVSIAHLRLMVNNSQSEIPCSETTLLDSESVEIESYEREHGNDRTYNTPRPTMIRQDYPPSSPTRSAIITSL
jgi:hypothetical protein